MRSTFALLALASLLLGVPSSVEARTRAGRVPQKGAEVRRVEIAAARIRLGDLIEGLGDLADLDLGEAPGPGAARLITRAELAATLERQAVQGVPTLPSAVRVVRKLDALTPDRVRALATEAIEATRPRPGIKLKHLNVASVVKVASGWERVTASVPRPPHRAGQWMTTVTLTFELDGAPVARVSVPASFDVSAEAARPDVRKGETVTLVVKRGLVEIAARATAKDDADVGDGVYLALQANGKIVRGFLVAPNRAVLEGATP